MKSEKILKKSIYETPLGPILILGDEESIYLLEFFERKNLEKNLQKKGAFIEGKTGSILSMEKELDLYFGGHLKSFKTPISYLGTPFQRDVWEELRRIPSGMVRSYVEIARNVGRPKACRAVAQANHSNSLAIVIPCHRVIYASGEIGGYAAGVSRKSWLLNHERGMV